MKEILKKNIISKTLLMPILNVKNNIKNRRQRLLDTFLSNIRQIAEIRLAAEIEQLKLKQKLSWIL